ncbi:hypothetical protein [Massilia aerilata]|uniref:Uncharacterized protein n=1 Tax=Massilia aerilata TaxID=453817 RepID=A0ABW0RVL4_9BURK
MPNILLAQVLLGLLVQPICIAYVTSFKIGMMRWTINCGDFEGKQVTMVLHGNKNLRGMPKLQAKTCQAR